MLELTNGQLALFDENAFTSRKRYRTQEGGGEEVEGEDDGV